MKTLFLLCLSCLGPFFWINVNFENEPEKVIAVAFYTYSHQLDTTNSDNLYNEEMVLLLGKNTSVFKSIHRSQVSSLYRNNPNMESVQQAVKLNAQQYSNPLEIYIFHQDKKIVAIDQLIKSYQYDIIYENTDWEITGNTKDIEGLACQEARTYFKGREWTVWFCPELPFQSGPWQLYGLPGLIVAATDTKHHISFQLTSFELMGSLESSVVDFEREINLEEKIKKSKALKVTAEQVKALWLGYERNSKEFIASQMKQGTPDFEMILNIEALAKRPKIYNPIELP